MSSSFKKDTIRINFEFPKKHYPYLKMLCAKKEVSLKDFATEILLKALEDYEDRVLAKRARKRLKNMDPKNNVSFDKAADLAGWDDESKV